MARASLQGVQTLPKARVGPTMTTEYVSYNPPSNVGITMVSRPWFFGQSGGGWRIKPEGAGPEDQRRAGRPCGSDRSVAAGVPT